MISIYLFHSIVADLPLSEWHKAEKIAREVGATAITLDDRCIWQRGEQLNLRNYYYQLLIN